MKVLICLFAVAAIVGPQSLRAQSAANPAPKVPVTAETAPKPEAFRDPLRKVKNANGELVTANLQPLFNWYQRRKGKAPMEAWGRTVATVIEQKPDGVVLLNYTAKKTFFLRNYPYKVTPNTTIQFFSIDSGFYTWIDPNGAQHTLHASDYGIPVNASSERKASAKKEEPSATGQNVKPLQ